MSNTKTSMARQIATAARDFQQRCTGMVPGEITVVLSDQTLVITLHGALSPAEKAMASSPDGAAQVQDFHRQLFANSAEPLRQDIRRITGVDVREAAVEVEPATGRVVQVFTTGTMVQVFLLAHSIPPAQWEAQGSEDVS